MSLHGSTIIVTGGATGIGRSYVEMLAGRGANVVIADVRTDEGERLAETITESTSTTALFVATDVTDEAAVADLVTRALSVTGRIDALVNNAAIYRDLDSKRDFEDIPSSEWDQVMQVNVRGTWNCVKRVAPHMKEIRAGRIVNIASVVAYSGVPGFLHYTTSKAAVIGMTRGLARELGPCGVTVNAIAPGLVSNQSSTELNPQEYLSTVAGSRALRREMQPDDLLGTLAFLASDDSRFITGQVIVVDGGGIMP